MTGPRSRILVVDDDPGTHTRASEALGLQRTYLSRLLKDLGIRHSVDHTA